MLPARALDNSDDGRAAHIKLGDAMADAGIVDRNAADIADRFGIKFCVWKHIAARASAFGNAVRLVFLLRPLE